MLKARTLLAAAVFCAYVSGAWAGYDEGFAALQRGEFAAALPQLKVAAQSGDARAQFVLGVMYIHSIGVPRDVDTGAKWLREAAERNHIEAQIELARMYETGTGVPQDAGRAAKWLRRAAEQGDVGAQIALADKYALGRGVPRDLVQAYKWYEVAAQYWGDLVDGPKNVVKEQMTPSQVAKATELARSVLIKKKP